MDHISSEHFFNPVFLIFCLTTKIIHGRMGKCSEGQKYLKGSLKRYHLIKRFNVSWAAKKPVKWDREVIEGSVDCRPQSKWIAKWLLIFIE